MTMSLSQIGENNFMLSAILLWFGPSSLFAWSISHSHTSGCNDILSTWSTLGDIRMMARISMSSVQSPAVSFGWQSWLSRSAIIWGKIHEMILRWKAYLWWNLRTNSYLRNEMIVNFGSPTTEFYDSFRGILRTFPNRHGCLRRLSSLAATATMSKGAEGESDCAVPEWPWTMFRSTLKGVCITG